MATWLLSAYGSVSVYSTQLNFGDSRSLTFCPLPHLLLPAPVISRPLPSPFHSPRSLRSRGNWGKTTNALRSVFINYR